MKETTIVWYSHSPSPYNSYLFKQIAEEFPSIKLETAYNHKLAPGRDWKEDFTKGLNAYFLKNTWGIDFPFLKRILLRKKQIMVIAGWDELMAFLLISINAFFNKKFILFSDRLNPKARIGLKQTIRKCWLNWVFKKMRFFFITGNCGTQDLIKMGILKEKVITFPFATDTDYFIPPERKRVKKLYYTFISSGRLLNSHKGYDIAINALALAKKKKPDFEFKYLIAGDGPDRTNLQDLIQRRGLEKEITLKGWTQFSDLLDFYHSGDIFLHPSRFDPFPNSVMEAMSCGLPVIGSDMAGSVLDRVLDGYNGYIHLAGDVEDLSNKILQVVNLDTNELQKMGENSRKTAMKWTVNYNLDQIRTVLNQLN